MGFMIDFEEAYNIVTGSAKTTLPVEKVELNDALNRILARDVRSDISMPPFDKSAVDGFACRRPDLPGPLKVLEVIPAGKIPEFKVTTGTCSRIMTGAPLPEGADTVIMVEDVEETGRDTILYKSEKIKNNICFYGEDIKASETVLNKGTLVKPQHIAVLATAGCVEPKVYRKVRVGIISTGDELVEPDIKPDPSQIRNSNASQLFAQIIRFGGIPDYVGIALDTPESTEEMIAQAFEKNDVVLLTGGVSMGDFDYVPEVMKKLGIEIKFDSIAVQPGRPTTFGVRGNRFIFGLPGNPVSSFVQFELLVKPLLYKLTGFQYKPLSIRLLMGKDFTRKKSVRLSWIPVRINDVGEVIPLEYHGSAHINALSFADGIIPVPRGIALIKKGELVNVRQI